MPTDQPPTPLPGRVPWRPLAAGVLVTTGAAGGIALDFALRYKSHVVLHLLTAYLIMMLLWMVYSIAYETRRRLLRIHVWFIILLFSAMLCFIHLDDAPSRLVYQDHEILPRPPAPQLYWSVALILLNVVMVTLHLFWLGRGTRSRKKPEHRARS